MQPATRPDCWQCRFFGLTYRPQTPYCCMRMGFMSRQLPAFEVLAADGNPCRGFQPK